jgi:uncharacterized protein (DUF1800 family)
MATDLSKIDPKWAWSTYEPTPEQPWTRAMAGHLYRRAGFGATGGELDQAMKLGPVGAVECLCNPPPPAAEFTSTSAMLAQRAVAGGNVDDLAGWWLHRMLNAPDPLQEKLTLFLHGHFATSAAKVEKLWMMLDQNELLRQHARGKFEELVIAVSRDPAMLIYLDSTTNRRIHPNENYARELMELFTLGVGNYTEQDIKEIARAFTGWEILNDRFHFDEIQHDTATKTFLGASGNFDGDDAVRIVLKQPAAPRFIAGKLIRFFVFDEPAASDALVEPIARDLREHEFRIGPAVQRILGSNLFFSQYAVGRKVRSPVDLAVGVTRALGATTSLLKLSQGIAALGQALFRPPNVKGWDGGRMWINSSTLLGRANFVGQLLAAPETRFEKSGGSLAAAARSAGAENPGQVVDWLLELLVAVPIPAGARDVLVQLATERDKADPGKAVARVIHAISALPEFQLA